jgi:hypothetical protein
MDLNFFGFNLSKKRQKDEKVIPSVVAPDLDDGTTYISGSTAQYYGYYMDIDGTVRNEIQAIQKYRQISLYPEVDEALQDITNEAIPYEDETPLVELVLDNLTDYSDSLKQKIQDEFDEILSLLKFSEKAADLFRRWYVDGRLYFNVLVDKNQPKLGIQELRPIECTKIRKVVEIKKDKTPEGVEVVKSIEEYYVYSENGFGATSTGPNNMQVQGTVQGVKLSLDSVVYVPSGYVDGNTGNVLSYLQKAIRPANQLHMLEDAVVIYRLSRAPERRIFYIDVGNLPKAKAEQYVKDIMNNYRNKLVYDGKTGEIRDDKKYMSMLEDFWMPRREGGKGTEITTLPAGQNLGQMEDVIYFQKKLYQAMNVPISRMLPETGFSLGRSTEITRDEVKFQKFIGKLRRRFTELFFDLLRTQLILKNIIPDDEWDDIKEKVLFRFQKDNYFSELKNQDLWNSRLMLLQAIDPYVGRYFSSECIKKNVLQLTDEEIKEMEKQMDEDQRNGFVNPMMQQMMPPGQDQGMPDSQGNQQQDPYADANDQLQFQGVP